MKKESNSVEHYSGTVSSDEFRELQERYSFIVNAYGEMALMKIYYDPDDQ